MSCKLFPKQTKQKDISSISGSDSETEKRITSESSSSSLDESEGTNYARVARNKPKISFRLNDSNVLVMQRCILHSKKVDSFQN